MKQVVNNAEVKFVEALNKLSGEEDRWSVICFAFSHLLEHYRSDYQLKIAVNLMQDVVKSHDAALYQCSDATIFLLLKDAEEEMLGKLIFQLRYLFMDDPLAYTSEGEENEKFSQIYNLNEQYVDILELSKVRLGRQIKNTEDVEKVSDGMGEPMAPTAHTASSTSGQSTSPNFKIMDAQSLVHIDRDLKSADLSRVFRRQPICAAIPDMTARRVFDEVYINIAHLRRALRSEVDLLSNRSLFKYITELLDERMLSLLKHNPGRYMDKPLSLNLNIKTILSDAFMEFDKVVKSNLKFSIVLEIQLADIFDDMAAYQTARKLANKMGYRICLDGITEKSFMQIEPKRLECDLVKLQWNASKLDDLSKDESLMMSRATKDCGVNRIILTRCDNEEAVLYGQAIGISLFQGRYLDSIIDPNSKIVN